MVQNSYKKLLLFLENQEKKTKNIIQKPYTEKAKTEIQYSSASIEDFNGYSYIPPTKQYNNSKGFNVEEFESFMRSKLIDNHVRVQNYTRPYISVSELYSCLRQVFYSRLNYSVDLNKQYSFSYLYMIQKIGNNVHDIIQNYMSCFENEKKIISKKYQVKGRIDSVNENFLYEIKTIDADKYENKYIKEHFFQANIYAHILNTEYDNYNIDTAVIVYAFRNLKKIIPFDIPIDNKLAKLHLERAIILRSSMIDKLPPDPIGARSENCRYCLYKIYCLEDQCSKIFPPFQKQNILKDTIDNKKKPAFLL